MNIRRQPAVVVLTSSSPAQQFKIIRQICRVTLREAAGRIDVWFSQLQQFESGRMPLIERHRMRYAALLNRALADHVRQLCRVGALPPSAAPEVEQKIEP